MAKGWSESMQEWWDRQQAAEVARHEQALKDHPQALEQASRAGLLLVKVVDAPVWLLIASEEFLVFPPTERGHLGGRIRWRLELCPSSGSIRAAYRKDECPLVRLPCGWGLNDAVLAAIAKDVHALRILRDGGPYVPSPTPPAVDEAPGPKARVRRRRKGTASVPAEGGTPDGADGAGV